MINMKGILSKFSYKLIVLQILFLYLFSQSADRFYYTMNYEIMECIHNYGPELGRQCLEKHPGYTINDLLTHPVYYVLVGLLIALIITGFVNWKKKVHFLNTILVFVLYIGLHFAGFFRFTRDLSVLLNSFGDLFSDKFWAMNLITLQIYLLSSILMIWLSVRTGFVKEKKNGYE